jgi:hypothetical protein
MRFLLIAIAILISAGANAQTVVGDLTAYSSGSYLAYLAPFDRSKTNGIDHSDAMIVQPAAFPGNTSIMWNWPANTSGVLSFLAIDFGDYLHTSVPVPITPKKLMNIVTLSETHGLTLSGSLNGYDAIIDFFTTSAAGSPSPQQHEVEIFLHTPAYSAAYVASCTPIGTYTDANGLAWVVAIDKSRLPHDILIMPVNGADIPAGTIDIKAMLTWLIGKSWIGGGEYFNGLALGVEVQQGIGGAAVNAFAVTYQ